MREKYVVRYDSNGHMLVITIPDGKVFMFRESPSGLHYLDLEGDSGMALVDTVANKRCFYSNQDYLQWC